MEFLVIVLILSVFVGLFFLLINDNPSANRKQDVDVEDDLIMLMDLNDDDYRDGWGRGSSDWQHSDMKDMAYFYVYKLYEQLVEKGNLK